MRPSSHTTIVLFIHSFHFNLFFDRVDWIPSSSFSSSSSSSSSSSHQSSEQSSHWIVTNKRDRNICDIQSKFSPRHSNLFIQIWDIAVAATPSGRISGVHLTKVLKSISSPSCSSFPSKTVNWRRRSWIIRIGRWDYTCHSRKEGAIFEEGC